MRLTNRVFPGDKVTAGNEAKCRQDGSKIVSKAENGLDSIAGLRPSGDAITRDVAVICHGIQSDTDTTTIVRSRGNVLVIRIGPGNGLEPV